MPSATARLDTIVMHLALLLAKLTSHRQASERTIALQTQPGHKQTYTGSRSPYGREPSLISNCPLKFVCSKKWSDLRADADDSGRR
jgi:hypothetical protein